MAFDQAYKYAMTHSEVFRNHDAVVKRCKKQNEKSPCMAFACSPNEAFYYGFDGCEMQKGKYSQKTTEWLAKTGMLFIIL